jgi:peptidoglycan hydrolase-like protein with peptidoglycan-binding domain
VVYRDRGVLRVLGVEDGDAVTAPRMNRLVMHHTGGAHRPNTTDLRAYHRVTDGTGRVHAGKFAVEANAPGRIQRGQHAAHTLNLNTGSIGAAIAAMGEGQWATPSASKWFPTATQIDGFLMDCAKLCEEWHIPVQRETCLSHAEVQITLRVTQRNKWDFDYPFAFIKTNTRDPVAIGDELRQEIRRIIQGLPAQQARPVPPMARPTLRQGATGAHVRDLQRALKVTVDGGFGPATRAAVVAFQRRNNLLPDGVVGAMTWTALGLG